MDVSVTEFRANLRSYLQQAQEGEEILVTDRGLPVARVVGAGRQTVIEALTEQGRIGRPSGAVRPVARGAKRVKAGESASDAVSAQRG